MRLVPGPVPGPFLVAGRRNAYQRVSSVLVNVGGCPHGMIGRS